MKLVFCLMVFALCALMAKGQGPPPPPDSPPDAPPGFDSFAPLRRFARQMPPPPPPPPEGMPMPPGMLVPRERREAKGGGAMPTRKG